MERGIGVYTASRRHGPDRSHRSTPSNRPDRLCRLSAAQVAPPSTRHRGWSTLAKDGISRTGSRCSVHRTCTSDALPLARFSPPRAGDEHPAVDSPVSRLHFTRDPEGLHQTITSTLGMHADQDQRGHLDADATADDLPQVHLAVDIPEYALSVDTPHHAGQAGAPHGERNWGHGQEDAVHERQRIDSTCRPARPGRASPVGSPPSPPGDSPAQRTLPSPKERRSRRRPT